MAKESNTLNRAVYLALRDKYFYHVREMFRSVFLNKPLNSRMKKVGELIEHLGNAVKYARLALNGNDKDAADAEFADFIDILKGSAEVAYTLLQHEKILSENEELISKFSGVSDADINQSKKLHGERAAEIMAGMKLLIEKGKGRISDIQMSAKKNFSKGDKDRYDRMYSMH
ncbi:MAG: hypothetical protein JW728_04030 [Candidatus Aureabacteria bacterium]|nr:hypothetical protein [Candidatus Auribacterota bacterium]